MRALVACLALSLGLASATAPQSFNPKASCADVLRNKEMGSSEWLQRLAAQDQTVALANHVFCRSQVPVSFLETGTDAQHLPAEFEEEEVEWERLDVTGEVPEPRMGSALGMIDGEVLVAGGCSKQHRCFRDLYIFNTASMTWRKRELTGIAPARQGTTSVVVGSRVYVFGGYDGIMYNTMHVLDTTLNLWSQMTASGDVPPPRMNAAMSKGQGNTIYLFGGTTDTSLYDDFYRLDIATATWERIPPAGGPGSVPSPREGATLSMAGNRLFLFGGFGNPPDSTTAGVLGDLWVFNVETSLWRETSAETGGAENAPWPRRGHSAVVVGDRIEFFGGCTVSGGETTGCFNDMVTLNIDSMVWSRPLSKGVAPEPRGGAKLLAMGRNILIFGGCDEKKTCYADMNTARLKFSTHRPSCPETSGQPGVNTPGGFAMECPMNCSGNGLCHQGTCFCDPGYEGADCGRALDCPGNCSDHGLCENGRCYCDPGFKGIDCATPELCPRNCSYRGVCHNGRCECDPGYTGVDCSRVVVCPHNCTKRGICLNGACFCSPGFGGSGCELTLPCPMNCSGNGLCHRQKCFCDPGWTGHDCSQQTHCPNDCSQRGMCIYGQCHCDPSFGGAACNQTAMCPNQCSQRGVCVHDRCVCEPGFTGSDCSKELFRCQDNCSRHGVCRFGKCYCFPGFEGEVCQTTVVCPNNCSNHGICIDGKCLCSLGFGGSDCSHGLACPNKCSGHGVCSEGKCYCDIGFAGLDCSVPFPCPNDCNNNGKCVSGKCYCDAAHSGFDCSNVLACNQSCNGNGVCANGKCFCNPGYYGHSCDKVFQCQGRCNAIKGNGVCHNGNCHCFPGYRGLECEEEVPCMDDCNGHGVCKNGQCYCAPGFQGTSCADAVPCPSQCRGHGTCKNGKCYCDPGYGGHDCSTVLECVDDCSGHGRCVFGMCHCDPGYGGENCGNLLECESATCPDGSVGQCGCRGECVHGMCFCDPGHSGEACNVPVTCPSNCNNNGICVNGACMCLTGYQGSACQDVVSSSGGQAEEGAPVSSSCPNGCSGHGICMADGTCACDPGFVGDDCSSSSAAFSFLELAETASNSLQPVVHSHKHAHRQDGQSALPLQASMEPSSGDAGSLDGVRVYREGDDRSPCNNHGVFANSKCFCDPGYVGEACDEEATCANNCHERGTCAMGLCYCSPGFTGVDCAEPVPCPNDCSGNGVCWNGRCSCDAGFEGSDCSDSKPRSDLSGLTVSELVVVCVVAFVVGLFLGLGIKSSFDNARKAKFNEMLREEVNKPFMSGA